MAGVLLYGGSFNPIHNGHLIVARSAAEQIEADRIILIPSAHPPHKTPAGLAPVDDRCAMCTAAVAGDPLFEVSDWEAAQTGPNYTLHTVAHFKDALPADTPLYWLVGDDSLAELHTWYRVDALLEACTVVTVRRGPTAADLSALGPLVSESVLTRVKDHILQTPRIDISATDIRSRVHRGRSIRHLVPDAVERYIADRGLFQD